MSDCAFTAYSALAAVPLAMLPEAVADYVGPQASRFTGRSAALEEFWLDGALAVVPITGALVNRGDWLGEHFGVTSYEGIAKAVTSAARDQRVRAILLDIDSPGGQATGAVELGRFIRRVSEDLAPVYAIANGHACSAAYAVACGARTVIATPSAVVGSIGVVSTHYDLSRHYDEKGVTPTLIHAGAHKVDGNFTEPLSDSARDEMQAAVDRYYELLTDHVGAMRGRKLSASGARETEAAVFIGADAQSAGLVDEVGTFEELLSYFKGKL